MMSSEEIFAILFGLFIGYWIVSKLIGSKPMTKASGFNDSTSKPNTSEAESDGQWYEILKVQPSASIEEIHAAYKTLIRQYHPDKVASLGDELKALAEKKSKAINAAYQEAIQIKG